MSVSREAIIAAYRAILGREPENEAVIESHSQSESLEVWLKTCVQSEEFASRMKFIYEKYGSSAAPEKPLSRGELGAWEEAARRHRAAVDRNPEDGDAWMMYGSALKELKQFELAESAYRRAIELKNGHAEIYMRLGDVLNHLNRRDEAQKAYVAAYRLDPNSRAAATRLRTLPPEVASSAFDMDRLLESDQEADDPSPVRGTARRELMSALGLPLRPLAESLTLAVKRPGEPRLFPHTAQALALISTRNFLPFARLAAQSFRVHHPEFEVFLLLVDGKQGDASDFGEGRVVDLSELNISRIGWYAAKFTASEFANAMKPSFLKYLSGFVEKVIYLDCDIAVFSRLTELIEAMDTCDVVLVPHMFTPVPKPEHYHTHPNRCDVFNSGLINAGCFAVNLGKAKEFIEFWENALLEPSAFFDEAGNQTDQQYLNWALIRVNNTGIVRDDRYNVAYWNLHERDLRVSTEGRKRQFKVDGKPLGFFHFSGYDIYDRLTLSKHDGRNEVYNFPAVAEILSWYSDQILDSPLAGLLEEPYPYDQLGNGFRLSPFVRRLLKKYERFVPKTALESAGGADALCAFLMDPLPATGSLLPLVLAEIYDSRPDLQGQWPGAHTAIAPDDLRWWFCRHAGEEYRIQFLIDHFRRSLVSDSSFGFAKQASTALGNSRLQFFGADRMAAARRLRVAGESGMAEMLLETRAEWVYFSEMSAAFVIYDNRPDIQSLFPDICGDDLEAFSDWLDKRAPEIHACPPGMGERLRRCGHGASLARVYSFLARREDVARRSQDSLLSDDPDPVLRELIRACGDGMELDLDDVIVLRHIHKWSRHRLVPLYLELPLVRERSESSRVAGRNLAVLPETVRRAPWALRGAHMHAACFDHFEARLDDEMRRSDLKPPTKPREVADLLRATWRQRHHSVATSEPSHRIAIRRLASAEFFSPEFASRLKDREHRPGVNAFGFFASDIGVGESSRGLARAISLLRPVNPVPTCTGQMREGTELTSLFQRFDYLTDTNVFVSYPHRAEDLLGRMRPEHLAGRRNVAHLAWEQKDANPWWKVVYDRYDEIWAISDFAATAFRDMFPGRVRVVPNVLNFDEFPTFPEAMETRLSKEQINFLFVFDANSSMERKNPEGVLEAFERAFKDTSHAPHVRLTLKVGGMHRPDHADRVEQLMKRAAASGLAIAFDGRQLSRDGLLRMIAEADCYVSLHRAEGFGYTMAEAMLYGVPVIASGYSGNLEYMTAKNSFLVPCKEAYVKAADGPFQRGSIWGEPDLDVAAELMRRAAEDRATFREVGKRGQETVIQALGANSIAETIRPFFDATQATSTVRADGGGATGEDGQSGVVSRRGDAKPTVRSGQRRALQ